jgi:hypothetical protein
MLANQPTEVPESMLQGLRPAGREFFRETAGEFEGWTGPKLRLLRLAAEALDDRTFARERIEAQGVLVTTPRGREIPHPLLSVERRAALLFAALTRQLGLDRDGER